MPHITVLAYHKCTASQVFGVIDAFAIANSWHQVLNKDKGEVEPLFSWDIVSIDGKPVEGEGRATIIPHLSIHEIDTTDVITIAGFLPPLKFVGRLPDELVTWLRHHHGKNTLIGTNCTGSFLLAETGLLDGKTATTNFKFARYFQRLYPKVKLKADLILTEDSGFVCSGATTSFMDLCLYLMEAFGYEDLASICGKAMLTGPRTIQTPYFIFDYQKDHSDNIVKKAQQHMEKKYPESISMEGLASSLCLSQRHFIRRFKKATGDSPLLYLQKIRIEAAKKKLEKTMQSIDEITLAVGYEDANSFRKLFKKNTGLSPKEYRNRFKRGLRPVAPKRRRVRPAHAHA